MRELSIEEKARRYDEALERMKSWARGEHPECFTEAQKAAEFVFPELAEGEDERIRKWIIKQIKTYDPSNIKDKALAWLERQGEKKPGSEEDEKMVRALMSICDEWATRHSHLPKENNDIEKIKSWLQSLKFNITDEELDKARKDAFKDAFYHNGDPTFNDGWSTAIWYLKKRLGI